MTKPSIQYIEDLTSAEIELLTQLLSIVPGNSPLSSAWLQDQETCLSRFPSSLLRPDALLKRIAMVLPFTPQKAQLCKTHKPLNPYLVRRIFLQVSAECTTRLTRLEKHPHLPADLLDFVQRLHCINSLWMSPDLYRLAYHVKTGEDSKRIESGCEACILSVIGGNKQILSDLRSSMLGRKKKRAPAPRLIRLVEAWIDWTGQGDNIRKSSDTLGREVRACRRKMQQARRQKEQSEEAIVNDDDDDKAPLLQQPTNAFNCPAEHEDEWENDHDLEGSIFDLYTQRWSKATFFMKSDGLHCAFRSSPAVNGPGTAFAQTSLVPEPLRTQDHPSQYSNRTDISQDSDSDSDYNLASTYDGSSEAGDLGRLSAECHAETYRNLVGIPETEAERRSARLRPRTPQVGEFF